MSNSPNPPARLAWPLLVAGCIACSGEVGDGQGLAGPEGVNYPTGSGALGPVSPGQNLDEADREMAARDPELFEVAERYFPGKRLTTGPTRLARLTARQLDATVQALLPEHHQETASESLPADPLQTNYEYADNLSFNAANFTPYTQWAAAIAQHVSGDPSSVIDCRGSGEEDTCLREEARDFVTRAFRGVTDEPQLQRFSDFLVSSVPEVGVAQAVADLVDVTLTSPGFVYRDEVHTDPQGMLPAAHWLQGLSYTLTDAPPGALGLDVEEASALRSGAEHDALVDKLLQEPSARDKLRRFFAAWLEIREPEDMGIATEVFPEFTAEVAVAMVEETRAFLDHVLAGVAPSLKDATQSTQSFVSDALTTIYDLDAAPAPGKLTQLDTERRLGIFTQPAVITSHSGPTTTRLVKRGVFFTRKVMCLPLGVPPPGVTDSVPEVEDATERERIETGTTPPSCQGCHAYINPFGFMQENFDAIGRWRTTDRGFPIDPRVRIDFLDEGTLVAESPVEALRAISESARFQQCFVRQLFRYYMARDERPGDDPVLRQMFFQFAQGDSQDILAAVRVLAGSSLLSQRQESP